MGKKKPVKLDEALHSALKHTQKEYKKKKGIEPTLGELVEKAFQESPGFDKVLEEERQSNSSEDLWEDENFMRL